MTFLCADTLSLMVQRGGHGLPMMARRAVSDHVRRQEAASWAHFQLLSASSSESVRAKWREEAERRLCHAGGDRGTSHRQMGGRPLTFSAQFSFFACALTVSNGCQSHSRFSSSVVCGIPYVRMLAHSAMWALCVHMVLRWSNLCKEALFMGIFIWRFFAHFLDVWRIFYVFLSSFCALLASFCTFLHTFRALFVCLGAFCPFYSAFDAFLRTLCRFGALLVLSAFFLCRFATFPGHFNAFGRFLPLFAHFLPAPISANCGGWRSYLARRARCLCARLYDRRSKEATQR